MVSTPAVPLTLLKRVVVTYTPTARIPTVIAAYWRLLNGEMPVAPKTDDRHAANYLYMLQGEEAHPDAVRALETYINNAAIRLQLRQHLQHCVFRCSCIVIQCGVAGSLK